MLGLSRYEGFVKECWVYVDSCQKLSSNHISQGVVICAECEVFVFSEPTAHKIKQFYCLLFGFVLPGGMGKINIEIVFIHKVELVNQYLFLVR